MADKEEVRLLDYVQLSGNRLGQIKYIGSINGKKGNFFGVELFEGEGKHSGTYKGKEYFKCVNDGMGCFVNSKAIEYILEVPQNHDPIKKLRDKRSAEKKRQKNKNSQRKSVKKKNKKQRISTKEVSKPSKPKPSKPKASKQPKYDNQSNGNKQKENIAQNERGASKERMSVNEFKSISIKSCLGKGDNFDIAKRICKFYDELFNDTDTVCLVSNAEIKPKYAISCEKGYKRTESYEKEGKFVLVYRAMPHIEANVVVKKQCFKSVVKGLAMDNENVYDILDGLNALFGDGCHVVRCRKISFDIYSRFSDGYECELRLPNSGDYVLAWRR